MKAPRVMIAAIKSGSGKTLITCSLLEALKKRGMAVSAFKCGPDYIDPMFHRTIIGVPSFNLDPFFSEEQQLKTLFLKNRNGSEISVLEGVMGLFDGLGGIREEGSAYHLASAVKAPILLVVDVHGMGRSVIPLLAGFLAYDREKLIQGVILNRISPSFYSALALNIEKELSVPVLGYFPVQKELRLESRHLGLVMPGEIKNWKKKVSQAADVLAETVSLERILEIADGAQELVGMTDETADTDRQAAAAKAVQKRVKIGVARDEAFCFFYEDNLRLLWENGAEPVYFSPIHDERLPENLDGLLFCGGYPELYAARLAANESMRNSVREAVARGMPSVAECGGFLYLHDMLRDKEGKEYAMCGVLPGSCFDTGKLTRFGYVAIREHTPCFLEEGGTIRGHEFHYYDSTDNGAGCSAEKPVTGKKWDCIHTSQNHWWGFAHLYYPSHPAFAAHFVAEAAKYRLLSEEERQQAVFIGKEKNE